MKKPALILHIGHGKTGTTSLQNYLYRNAIDFRRLGYLFPTRNSVRENHILLPAGFVRGEGFHIAHKQIYLNNFKRFERDFKRFWAALVADIDEFSPHTVILSAEQMFRDFSATSRIPLAEFLGEYFSDVTVVAYIRSPAPDYFSRLAQRLKTGSKVPDLAARKIRGVIEYYEGQFPDRVRLHPFDRQQMNAGDILQDFISRYVPEALSLVKKPNSKDANTSSPWPLLRGLRELRLRVQPNAEAPSFSTRARVSVAALDYNRLHPEKQKFDVRLLPDVEDFLQRSAVDHLWLRDRYGVVFSDLDYAQIDNPPSPFPADMPLDRIVDFTKCPQKAFPVERYLGNGAGFWVSYLYFFVRVEYSRIHRVFVHDSRIWRWSRSLFGR